MPSDNGLTLVASAEAGAKIPDGLRLLIGAISGAALSLSFTGLYLSIYSWICVGVLLLAVFGARGRVAFACGFLHAFLFVLISVPWIATVLRVHGGLSIAGGWGVLLLIASAWGVLVGSFALIVHRVSRRSIELACIAAPFAWVTFEFVRAHLPEISFPWNLLGYPASVNLGLLQITTLTGIYGLSFLAAAFNALLAWVVASKKVALKKRIVIAGTAAAVLVTAMLTGPHLVPEAKAQHFVRAVQLNFPEVPEYPPDWFAKNAAQLDEILKLSLAPSAEKPDLLVWPEVPAPFSFEDTQFAKLASGLATRFSHPFLAGVIEWKQPADASDGVPPGQQAAYNSAILVDPQGQRVFTYDKIHLVPFGEYEPFPLIHRVVANISTEVGGFRKGNRYAVGRLPNGNTFGVFICYEAIYPGEVRRFAANGAQLFLNISNDGWFGRSAAAEQHLHMVRVRAVENRRWIVRATNNGFTASVDPYGRMIQPLPPDVRAAADLPYDFRTDETIYTRFGDWFAWLCVIVSAILLLTSLKQGNKKVRT
ncbi:MAG TPA: apolipoprotein N-acyltransferase [Candidatus Acidoferrum sp.]|nr:apolipoprotein N-acyltransferase [Candidatus Acidoferrum sp.]